jgi:hypothetical protein
MMEEHALELIPPETRNVGLVRLVDTPEAIAAAWREFQALKAQLLEPHDYQEIQGRTFVKKSGYRKLAAAFGVSLTCIDEVREDITGGWLWRITVQASAPNGRHADGVAICASNERRMSHPEHDTYSTAYTRAANRAIADLIGGGEVSAEEMDGAQPQPRPRSTPRPSLPVEVVDPDAPANPSQLQALRGHLNRIRKSEQQAATELGVSTLENLTRELAAEALRRLSREPNAH